jgi:hypothetical protein
LRPVEVRLRDLPEVEFSNTFGYESIRAGGWTFDPIEENDAMSAMESAKAWAAYALWLNRNKS